MTIPTNNELDILLGSCAAIIGVLAFANEFPDKKYVRRIKSLSFKLVVFIVATIIGVWATVQKNSMADKEKSDEKLNSQKEQRKNDLLNRRLTDESNSKIVNSFTTALAKYNLKYDSSQKVVLKTVRDSLKTQIINKNNPELNVLNIESKKYKDDTLNLIIHFICKQATGYKVTLKRYAAISMIRQQAIKLIASNEPEFFQNIQMAEDKEYQYDEFLNSPPKNIDKVFFLFIGMYENIEGKKFKFQRLYYYDFINKAYGIPFSPYYNEVLSFFKDNGIKTQD